MILSRKLSSTFTKMILFEGALSFSPNTLNNGYMTFALAKKWQEEDAPYEAWMNLISKVREINKDVSNINPSYNLNLFSDWNVEGDGSVYCDFKAKAVFDPTQPTPFEVLPPAQQFRVSSPMGFHKAVIADMDTDAQDKSKIFGSQMVIDDRLSLALQPTEFRNMARKYLRNIYAQFPNEAFIAVVFGVDWFQIGQMALLSHKDTYKAKHKILNEFAHQIQQGKEDPQILKQKYIFRMNQFNYNNQTKLSYVVGYIEPTTLNEPLPTALWRTSKLEFTQKSQLEPYEYKMPNMAKTFYMREIKSGNSHLGILLDLNNLLEVFTVNGQFAIKYQLRVTITPSVGANQSNTFVADIPKAELKAQCGMHFISDGFLLDVPYIINIQSFDKDLTSSPQRVIQGTESEFTFEIVERFEKTRQIISGDNAANIQNFEPYITYDFRCMRFGKNIPSDVMRSIKSEVTLDISYDYSKNGTPIDVGGISLYAGGKSDETLAAALENPIFAAKYKDMANIKKQYYQSMYDYVTEVANTLIKQVESPDPLHPNDPKKNTYFWKNSKGQHFAPQFNDPTGNNPSIRSQTVKLDAYGHGSFKLYLNQNLTRFNNPRTLVPSELRCKGFSANPILSSIATSCNIKATFLKDGTQTIQSQDDVSGIYYQSNPDLGQQFPDWKNYVGPRLRLMGLIYPAMQKIVNLYSFKHVDLDSMKRAFDVESEKNPRYMPSTREISSFEHHMIRRWLYEPFFNNDIHTNIDFKRMCTRNHDIMSKPTFQQKKTILRNKLKDGFAFELFTIPLYLTAMYTSPSNQHQQIFRQVVHDEMKHLFIASNLLNAIREPGCTDPSQGPPYLDQRFIPSFVQGTPSRPLYCYNTTNSPKQIQDLYSFNIFPLNNNVLLKMIAAEFPSETNNLVLSTEGVPQENQKLIQEVQDKVINAVNAEKARNPEFHTVGELYAEIISLLWDLNKHESKDNVIFSGDAAMQFTYPQLTNMVEIYSLRTALNQIRLIVDEGEGARIFDVTSQLKKLSHFLKFIEVYTGCKVDQEKTDLLNGPGQSRLFTIYFKKFPHTNNARSNNWTPIGQNSKLQEIVDHELPGSTAYGYSKYTNVASIPAFSNVYKKILLELHYVFNSNFENFKTYIVKKKDINPNDLAALTGEFKAFKFKRMENAISKMRQMSLHARYNIRQDPIPNYEVPAPINTIESKGNQGLSVRPDYNVNVEFPEDDE